MSIQPTISTANTFDMHQLPHGPGAIREKASGRMAADSRLGSASVGRAFLRSIKLAPPGAYRMPVRRPNCLRRNLTHLPALLAHRVRSAPSPTQHDGRQNECLSSKSLMPIAHSGAIGGCLPLVNTDPMMTLFRMRPWLTRAAHRQARLANECSVQPKQYVYLILLPLSSIVFKIDRAYGHFVPHKRCAFPPPYRQRAHHVAFLHREGLD